MNLRDLLPEGITPEDIVVGMATLTAFITSVAIWQTLVIRDRLGPRLKALSARRAALRQSYLSDEEEDTDEGALPFMRHVVQRFKLMKGREAEKATLRLTRAGMRDKDAMVIYLFLKLCLPFIFGFAGILVFYWLHIIRLPGVLPLAVTLAMVLIGAFAPDLYIGNIAERRRQKLEKAMPDTLDLMVIAAEVGLSLDASLGRVSKELAPGWPEMADELTLTAIELTFLPDRRRALDNLASRTNLEAIRAVINTLRQSEKYGTPLAQSLRVLSAEFRNERMMKAEEKAARLPVLMTLPMVLFILPPLFIVLIGPAALSIIDQLSKISR